MIEKLSKLTGLNVYASSVVTGEDGATYFLARREQEKLVGTVGLECLPGAVEVGKLDDKCVGVGPMNHEAACLIRQRLPWTAPKCLGLAMSVGLGDRLGLATPGHIRAIRGRGPAAILPQQSIREMSRTHRTSDDVMDAATWGVLQEGFTEGFGSDADHLQKIEDIDVTAAAGFTMFTIDPGAHVVNEADTLDQHALGEKLAAMDLEALEVSTDDLKRAYAGKSFALDGGGKIAFDDETFLRAAVKYGGAIAHTVKMHRHLRQTAKGEFELEVSVDETESPTSPAEHYLFSAELKRLGVKWISMAPRFIGRFEKGVDYIGDIDKFRESFARHVAVMRTLGPYKMSIHSGSDKFSIYPTVAELAGAMVHLKTAGTSYLEAVRAIGMIAPSLFREIYDFARAHYDEDKKTYHVSADMTKVRPASEYSDEQLADLIDDFDTRQALHCTYGSVLTADDGERFKRAMYDALNREEEIHYLALEKHLGRHVAPFANVTR